MLSHYSQYLKHLLVNTPLEGPALALRDLWKLPQRLKQPELKQLFQEERAIAEACTMVLRSDSNTIDVGAHLGAHLSSFLALAHEGRHMAFEPVPHKANWLRRKFPEVDIRELALHETSGQQEFFVNTENPGFSGLRIHHGSPGVETIRVEQRTLDEVVGNGTADLIKIDVEGAELFVLRGARKLLQRCRPMLVFESTLSALEVWKLTPMDLYLFLQDQGYRVYLPRSFISGGNPLTLEEYAVAHEYPFLAFNFIAVAVERPLGRKYKAPLVGRADDRNQPGRDVVQASV